MRFVHDDGLVAAQQGIAPEFREEHAVGHELDFRLLRHVARKAVLPADQVARRTQLVRHAFRYGDGGNAPRLRARNQPRFRQPCAEADLRQLGRFAGSRSAANDDNRMPEDGPLEFLHASENREAPLRRLFFVIIHAWKHSRNRGLQQIRTRFRRPSGRTVRLVEPSPEARRWKTSPKRTDFFEIVVGFMKKS